METYKGHDIARREGDKWYYHYAPKADSLDGGFTGKAMSIKECRKCIDIWFKKAKHKKLNIAETLSHSSAKNPRDRVRKRKLVDGPQGMAVYSK